MKTFLLLGLLLTASAGAYAQQQTAATDAWGTPTTPAATETTNATPDAAAPATADAAAPSGIESALGSAPAPATGVNSTVKPMGVTPKLNPNSAGSYDKKVVKTQNKHSDKVIMKRRRATSRYADMRRNDQMRDIRKMDKAKQ